MENFDPEMLFPPSQEKINTRNEILNRSILSLGIEENQSIIHFGCGSRNGSFAEYIKDVPVKYFGVDVEETVIKELRNKINGSNLYFLEKSIQSFIDDEINKSEFDWSIIEGIIDKNVYGDSQYEFVDTIIRKCLVLSKNGIAIIFNNRKTKNDDSYNADFLMAYLSSIYNRFSLIRLNENEYLFCVFKYYV